MKFGKAVKFNVLQTSRIIHNLSNGIFISNNIINTMVYLTSTIHEIALCAATTIVEGLQ